MAPEKTAKDIKDEAFVLAHQLFPNIDPLIIHLPHMPLRSNRVVYMARLRTSTPTWPDVTLRQGSVHETGVEAMTSLHDLLLNELQQAQAQTSTAAATSHRPAAAFQPIAAKNRPPAAARQPQSPAAHTPAGDPRPSLPGATNSDRPALSSDQSKNSASAISQAQPLNDDTLLGRLASSSDRVSTSLTSSGLVEHEVVVTPGDRWRGERASRSSAVARGSQTIAPSDPTSTPVRTDIANASHEQSAGSQQAVQSEQPSPHIEPIAPALGVSGDLSTQPDSALQPNHLPQNVQATVDPADLQLRPDPELDTAKASDTRPARRSSSSHEGRREQDQAQNSEETKAEEKAQTTSISSRSAKRTASQPEAAPRPPTERATGHPAARDINIGSASTRKGVKEAKTKRGANSPPGAASSTLGTTDTGSVQPPKGKWRDMTRRPKMNTKKPKSWRRQFSKRATDKTGQQILVPYYETDNENGADLTESESEPEAAKGKAKATAKSGRKETDFTGKKPTQKTGVRFSHLRLNVVRAEASTTAKDEEEGDADENGGDSDADRENDDAANEMYK